MLEVIWHTIKHSLILLPFLFLSYVVIELIEYQSAKKLQHSRLLSNKWSTVFGAGFGLIPQCGFSVVATDLFASKKIRLGTLLAVYIATSDEAIPLLISSPGMAITLLPLLLIKFVVAILVGFLVDLILRKKEVIALANKPQENHSHDHIEQHTDEKPNHDENLSDSHTLTGCCGHDIDTKELNKKDKVKKFILHPLIHTLKIFGFILIVNLIFNTIIHFVGEDTLKQFLNNSNAFAPLIASIIGLIPNCVSSVIVTNLYTIGGISFGALVAGLIVNAGIAFVVLFKQNKNIKQNFFILGLMFAIGLTIGYTIQLIGF